MSDSNPFLGGGSGMDVLKQMGVNVDEMDNDLRLVVLFVSTSIGHLERVMMEEVRQLQTSTNAAQRLVSDSLTETRNAQRSQGERIGSISDRLTEVEHQRDLERIKRKRDEERMAQFVKSLADLTDQIRPMAEQQIKWKAQFALISGMAGVFGGGVVTTFLQLVGS